MDMMEMPMQAPHKVWRRGNIVYFSDDCEAEPLFKLKEHLMDISMDRRNPYAGIVINSYGGNADSIAFYDWLKAYPIPLVTFVEGGVLFCRHYDLPCRESEAYESFKYVPYP